MNPVTLASFVLLAAQLIALAVQSHNPTTVALVVSSVLMFGCSLASAVHLLGVKPALRFVAISLPIGWFAEQMGASHGWFFGDYDYTTVLGPQLGDVPVVIPLMWFSLAYMGYVIANLIVWRRPVDGSARWSDAVVLSFLAAMIITAFDLGADPYFVFQLKAWVMVVKDGWWFGETIQGFFGWMFVSFVIVFLFRLTIRGTTPPPWGRATRRHALVPVVLYAGFMVFQMAVSEPMELRTIAFFAMGMPILCALAGLQHWKLEGSRA
jgi:putative membrane protein